MKPKSFLLWMIFASILQADEDFIDDLEYGKRLYENPRGIGCQKCHGDKGKGGIIATYTHRGKIKELYAPQINTLTLEEFAKYINESKGVMPKYYLTPKEILAIYKYLKN